MRIARLLAAACLAAASAGAGEPAPQGARPPVPQLPIYAEDAIPPGLRAEIVRETPGRLDALKGRMDAQWARVKAEMGKDMECLQFVRTLKRMEIARRLFGFAGRELARGNTDGLAFAFLATEDLRRFCDLFDEELRLWKDYPLAPGVKPVVIRVADYGAKGDGKSDNIAAFDAAIAAARALQGRPAVIEVGEGEFHFSPATNRVQVLLANLTNVVMRGVSPEKTRLRFDDMDSPGLAIHSCYNTTVSDLELASTEAPFFQGVVEAFDKAEGWAVVRQHPGTARPDGPRFSNPKNMFCLGIFGPDGNELVDNWHELFFDNKAEDLGDGRFRVFLKKDHFIYKRDYSRLEPGWQIVIPLRKGFCQNAATTGNSRQCNFANVWVRNARGCAVSFCSGAAIYSSAWRVRVFPFPGLLAAANADAIMNYRGTFIGECAFDHLNDDGANAHALGRKIMRVEGGDTVIADYLHGNYEAGDPMQVLGGQTGQYLYLGRVKRPGRDLKGGWVHNTQFEEPLPPGIRTIENAGTPALTEEERRNQLIGGAKVDAKTVPDALFRPYMFGMGNVVYKTRFSSLRGSGAVLMCPNTLLEEVTYEHMNRGVALTCLPNFGEGPTPYNVWIRNCTFRDVPMGVEGRCVKAAGGKFLTAPVRGLTLEGNVFEDVATPLCLDNVGDDVEIR